MARFSNHRRVGLFGAGLLLLLAALLFAFRDKPPLASVLLLNRPLSPPVLPRDRLSQWIPPSRSWAWLNMVEDLLFGRRKSVNFDQEIFAVAQQDGIADSLGLGSPSLSRSGTPSVWFLSHGELTALRGRLKPFVERINRAGINTAEGIGTGIFSGESVVLDGVTNQVGMEANYFARIRSTTTDLFASLQFSELETNRLDGAKGQRLNVVVRTNLNFTARMQVPPGCGFFVLNSSGAGKKGTGVIVEPR
jgi:hypothetical protein